MPCSKASFSLSLSCTKISGGILTRMTCSTFKPSIKKYLCKLFFRPFCPHSLIPVRLEKQLTTSLRATRSRGNIYPARTHISPGLGSWARRLRSPGPVSASWPCGSSVLGAWQAAPGSSAASLRGGPFLLNFYFGVFLPFPQEWVREDRGQPLAR